MISILLNIIENYKFRKKWKKLNKHNQTYAINIFNSNIVKIGNMSYGPLEINSWGNRDECLIIGNYVSISSGVKFILGGNHYYNTFSTYPFKVNLEIQETEAYSNGPIVVDDDVWIGTDAMIMSGVTIGKGAVVAAGSIVTKDVIPYSIVGGNPAKIIKMRFEQSIIDKIINVDYCKLNHVVIRNNIDLFYKELNEDTLNKILCIIKEK